MLNFIKNVFFFRMGQTSARGAARMVGLGRLAVVIGLVGGWRAMRRQARA
jgi:hypothetical protein